MLGALWPYLAAAGAALVGFIGLWLKAKSAGRAEARQEQETANADAYERGADIQGRVQADGADAARKWLHEHRKRPGG